MKEGPYEVITDVQRNIELRKLLFITRTDRLRLVDFSYGAISYFRTGDIDVLNSATNFFCQPVFLSDCMNRAVHEVPDISRNLDGVSHHVFCGLDVNGVVISYIFDFVTL
ncbi:hypothetical protein DGG96_08335 [Legionella qingyii]|uniref:Uncharacterized protein n=1 Tax=Legionella qingyii TaxID=2184757 RepID=A0A317U355_9GAMM|nr:hypothetical protein DGG96_08335 [Legionella qingyii]